jgi:hypothetical protein
MSERDQAVSGSTSPSPGCAVAGPLESIPDVALSSRPAHEAFLVARDAHGGPGHGDTRLSHPEDRFGVEIAGLVAGLTEDRRIARYPARKAEARTRAIHDRRVATIYAADKLANTIRLLDEDEAIDGECLDHYVKTLRLFSEQCRSDRFGGPDHPVQMMSSLARTVSLCPLGIRRSTSEINFISGAAGRAAKERRWR